MPTKPKIRVYFVVNYVPDYDYEIFVGNIDSAALEALISKLSDKHNGPKSDSCIRTMALSHKDNLYYGANPFYDRRNQSLEISDLFYFDNSMPKCMCNKNDKKLTEQEKTNICYKNLRSGKCCDKFMRETMGTILFPKHYTKQYHTNTHQMKNDISILNLSNRATNALRRGNIHTIEDLIVTYQQLDRREFLLKFRSIGTQIYDEISDAITKLYTKQFDTNKTTHQTILKNNTKTK